MAAIVVGSMQPSVASSPTGAAKSHVEAAGRVEALEESILLLAPSAASCPIVAASKGFAALSGRPSEELSGRAFEFLIEGASTVLVSRSSLLSFADFCRVCARDDLSHVAPASMLQPLLRQDGSTVIVAYVFGLGITPANCRCIVGAGLAFPDGDLPGNSQKAALLEVGFEAMEQARAALGMLGGSARPLWSPDSGPRPTFAFFSQRLQRQSLLSLSHHTAERREPDEVAKGCMVFSDRPVPQGSEGVSFRLRVDGTTERFSGLPLLGFTRRPPADVPGLYPTASRCQGASVLIGCSGEAFARDHLSHFQMGFSKPPSAEVQMFVDDGPREPMPRPRAGDELECIYTRKGHMKLLLNGVVVLDFDVGRPARDDADYFAVVDVCFSTTALTVLPDPSSSSELKDGDDGVMVGG